MPVAVRPWRIPCVGDRHLPKAAKLPAGRTDLMIRILKTTLSGVVLVLAAAAAQAAPVTYVLETPGVV